MALAGSKPLTNVKQEAFVQAVLSGENQTQAYILAGYSDKGADGAASRLLGVVRVRERLQFLQKRAAVKAEISAASVIERLDRNAETAFDTGDISASTTALVALGKTMGIFVEQVKDVTDLARVPSSVPGSGLRAAGTLLVGSFGKPKA